MDEWLFLFEAVAASWKRKGPFRRITAAVSGGADSAALLRALWALREREDFALTAAHVDHGLRPASGADAEFVAALCKSLNVACDVRKVQVAGKSEDAARAARYEALFSACAQAGADVLALAHHRRDQAETVLLHLFRGSGSGGLGGMQELSFRARPGGEGLALWRPLLTLPPDVIRAALRAQGIPWREDETNAGDDYLRNYLRHQVLPAIEARLPQAEEAVSRAARLLAEEDGYFRSEARRFLAENGNACLSGPCRWVRYAPLARLHPALRRYALRLAAPVALDLRATDGLMALAPGQKMNLPENWRAVCGDAFLHFLPPKEADLPAPPGPLTALPWEGKTGDGKRLQALPRKIYQQCALRAWETGDVIHPLGAKGVKSMQDYFVDKKIPQPFRRHVPLLCAGKRVVWAIGVGVGEEARVNPGDDAVMLRYDGFLPGDPGGAGEATKENQ